MLDRSIDIIVMLSKALIGSGVLTKYTADLKCKIDAGRYELLRTAEGASTLCFLAYMTAYTA